MSTLPVVTLDELKQHLRVEYDADDSLIESYGLAAVEYAEQICDREIIKRTDQRAVCESIEEVPQSIKTWVKLYVADLYERRSITEGSDFKNRNYDHLLDAWILYDRVGEYL